MRERFEARTPGPESRGVRAVVCAKADVNARVAVDSTCVGTTAAVRIGLERAPRGPTNREHTSSRHAIAPVKEMSEWSIEHAWKLTPLARADAHWNSTSTNIS
jgi:hypothetical protein